MHELNHKLVSTIKSDYDKKSLNVHTVDIRNSSCSNYMQPVDGRTTELLQTSVPANNLINQAGLWHSIKACQLIDLD